MTDGLARSARSVEKAEGRSEVGEGTCVLLPVDSWELQTAKLCDSVQRQEHLRKAWVCAAQMAPAPFSGPPEHGDHGHRTSARSWQRLW